MAEGRLNIQETSSLISPQSIVNANKCYGTTRKQHTMTFASDYKIIKHQLCPTDTLQGLAIKYETTVEQIRRVNKLWTNDDIILFKILDIPVKDRTGDTEDQEVILEDIECDVEDNERIEQDGSETLDKYLTKLDKQIKQSKKQAKKQRKNSGETIIKNLSEATKELPTTTRNTSHKHSTLQSHASNLDHLDNLFEL